MEDIAIFYNELAKFTGLPLWIHIVLLTVIILCFYLYGIFIPFSIKRIRKELINLNQKFETSSGGQDKYEKNRSKSKYRWKS